MIAYYLLYLKATMFGNLKFFTQLSFILGRIISWRRVTTRNFGNWWHRFHNTQFLRKIMRFIQFKTKFWLVVASDHIVNQSSIIMKTFSSLAKSQSNEQNYSAGKSTLNSCATTADTTGSLSSKSHWRSTTVTSKAMEKSQMRKTSEKQCLRVTWKTYCGQAFKQ